MFISCLICNHARHEHVMLDDDTECLISGCGCQEFIGEDTLTGPEAVEFAERLLRNLPTDTRIAEHYSSAEIRAIFASVKAGISSAAGA